ncbi:hypothetical protein, partial [uncultured Selenomonas sp.]|uniref:hypothetical protein n=1 Tax=uncultured Selenomonas sp. TaxID=159275 RepID=UPI0025FC78AA
VDMHFHILADVFFFDNMNYSSKLFNPTSFVIEPDFFVRGAETGRHPQPTDDSLTGFGYLPVSARRI